MPQVWGGVGCCASLLLLALGDAQRSIALILFSMCTFLFAFSASYGTHRLTRLTHHALALRHLQHIVRNLMASPIGMHDAAAVFWVLCAELFSMGSKAPASSAAMAVLFASGAAANLIFLTLHTWLRYAAFLVFAAVAGKHRTQATLSICAAPLLSSTILPTSVPNSALVLHMLYSYVLSPLDIPFACRRWDYLLVCLSSRDKGH